MLYPISAVCYQPDKMHRLLAQSVAGVKCHRKEVGCNQSGCNILGITDEPRKPGSDAQPGRCFTGMSGFCRFGNLTECFHSISLIWNEGYPVTLCVFFHSTGTLIL